MICPSRNHPDKAAKLRANFRATRGEDTKLVFALDDDDSTVPDYPYKVDIGPSRDPVSALNRAALRQTSKYVGFVADDNRFITDGWDTLAIQHLEEMGGGVVYGDDLVDPGALPNTVFLSSSIVQTLGYMVPPDLTHGCFDNFWFDIGEGIGKLRYVPEIVIQHLSLPGKSLDSNVHDYRQYWDWRNTRRDRDVALLR